MSFHIDSLYRMTGNHQSCFMSVWGFKFMATCSVIVKSFENTFKGKYITVPLFTQKNNMSQFFHYSYCKEAQVLHTSGKTSVWLFYTCVKSFVMQYLLYKNFLHTSFCSPFLKMSLFCLNWWTINTVAVSACTFSLVLSLSTPHVTNFKAKR